jgi:large subunit ribosomal protein L30
MAAKKKDNKQLKITLVRSIIGRHAKQKATVKALGLHKMHHTVVHYDSPTIRGMVNRVSHLIKVEEE